MFYVVVDRGRLLWIRCFYFSMSYESFQSISFTAVLKICSMDRLFFHPHFFASSWGIQKNKNHAWNRPLSIAKQTSIIEMNETVNGIHFLHYNERFLSILILNVISGSFPIRFISLIQPQIFVIYFLRLPYYKDVERARLHKVQFFYLFTQLNSNSGLSWPR